jgi:hypothetical protein
VQVTLDARSGLPHTLHEGTHCREIAQIQDAWRIDDEWWREPISRHYLQVLLRDGAIRTLFHDRLTDRWFAQSY